VRRTPRDPPLPLVRRLPAAGADPRPERGDVAVEARAIIGGHYYPTCEREVMGGCDCAERIYDELQECPECGGPLDKNGLCADQYWADCVWVGQ
jgi:hypothetical protein